MILFIFPVYKMKNKFLSVLVFLLYSGAVFGQEYSFPELEGFKKYTNYPVYTSENLWDFIDGAADTYLALGFVDLHVAEYKKGKESIKVEIYRHQTSSLSFGIYASERSPTFRFINLGSQGYIADGAINFFKGDYYVKIRTYSQKAKTLQAEESLATRIALMLRGNNDMPAELSLFPEAGRKQNAETYINESVLGHPFLNKAFKAEYESGSNLFSIFIIKCTSPTESFNTANTYLSKAGIDVDYSETGKFAFSDGYNGNIYLAWDEGYVVIISGLAKDQTDIADKYASEALK
jgi:hypothetical protein